MPMPTLATGEQQGSRRDPSLVLDFLYVSLFFLPFLLTNDFFLLPGSNIV